MYSTTSYRRSALFRGSVLTNTEQKPFRRFGQYSQTARMAAAPIASVIRRPLLLFALLAAFFFAAASLGEVYTAYQMQQNVSLAQQRNTTTRQNIQQMQQQLYQLQQNSVIEAAAVKLGYTMPANSQVSSQP